MRKVLAIFIILVFVIPLVTAALFVLPVRAWILDRNFYARALSGEHLSNLIQNSPTFPLQLHLPVQFSQTALDSFYAIIKGSITSEYLDSQIKPIIDNSLNWLEGKTSTMDFKLDLKPFKTALLTEKRDAILQVIAQNIPVCTSGQQGAQKNGEICRPANLSVESFNQTFIAPALNQIVQALPDEYSVQTPQNLSIDRFYFWNSIFPGLTLPNMLTLAAAIVTFLALLFWLLSALIADSSWSVRLKWLGGALILPALIVLGVAALIQFINTAGLINLGLSGLGQVQLTSELKTSLADLFHSFSSQIAIPFFISGGIALGSAIALIVWGSFTKPKKVEPVTQE
jgi:hypothetical protein